ncbi:hypothetical protein [Parapedobacter soli]|uniref:hypothetical protein n=1 Tax=Parapedobacter soli TaxID=416955 RepID=UPI0021C7C6D3|nr:hypothetical protein [Parapedobacter soli]
MDRYSLNARIYPVVIFYMPAIILAVLFLLKFDNYIHLFTSFGIVGALSYLFSQLGRDGGRRKERKLWRSWGGAPTTQLLRWSNNEINVNIKKRYHNKLSVLCPVDDLPDPAYEQANPVESDEIYQYWTKFLISKTRDTQKYSVLFKENMNYGFRRNLWGMKTYAIWLILILMVGTYGYYWLTIKSINPTIYPMEFLIAEVILLVIFFFWIFVINKNWIKVPAFAYAERLLEATEELD